MSLKDSTKQDIVAKLEQIIDSPPWHIKEKLEAYKEKLKQEYMPQERTMVQNRSLHLWYSLVAEALNDAGYTVQLVLKEKVDLAWDGSKVKELLWRPAQITILGKGSTKELSKTEDIDAVFDHLVRHLGEKFGVQVDFPHNENNE